MTDVIAVDVETTGLDVGKHMVIEVAAVNVQTEEELYFVPFLHPDFLAEAEPEALAVNRYFERRVFRNVLSQADTATWYQRLWDMLSGNTFAGANARFDAAMLCRSFDLAAPVTLAQESWKYRLLDLGSYAAGALGHEHPLSLQGVCDELGINRDNLGDAHSALGDARATAACIRKIQPLGKTVIR